MIILLGITSVLICHMQAISTFNPCIWTVFSVIIIILIFISNSNWTEWSTIQAVIGRVISKSAEREAQGRFEITSTITP